MKKFLAVLAITLCIGHSSKAQDYSTAIGIRLAPSAAFVGAGFTIKHFIKENNAVEGILGIGNGGISIGGLYEWHNPINTVENLQWFAGAGAYVAFLNSTSAIGATGIVGLDYKFAEIPLNISLDWKPELNIISTIGFEGNAVGISARFTF